MSTAVMTKHTARTMGLVYLSFFLTSVLTKGLQQGLIAPQDAAATAAHILGHQSRFQLGIASSLVATGLYLALTALFYYLFEPVNRMVSLVAAWFGVVGCAIQAGGSVFEGFALVVLGNGHAGNLSTAEEAPALAMRFLKLNDQAVDVALVYFAVYCLLIGWLIWGSSFLPRVLGALMVLAGIGWLTFLYEPLADRLFPYVAGVGVVAEVSLMLWLLTMGVNAERWRERAAAMGAAPGSDRRASNT
jgi:hypothetical protein